MSLSAYSLHASYLTTTQRSTAHLEIAVTGPTAMLANLPKQSRKPQTVHHDLSSQLTPIPFRTAIPAKLRVDNLHYDLTEDDLYVSYPFQRQFQH
jgi:hypothetical protein